MKEREGKRREKENETFACNPINLIKDDRVLSSLREGRQQGADKGKCVD
jgi:hypothetical protein